MAASLSHSGKSPAYTQYVDGTRPALASAVVDVIGDEIFIFDEGLAFDGRGCVAPAAARSPSTADGAAVTVGPVLIWNSYVGGSTVGRVQLTELSPAIAQGQAVTVSYTDPTGRRRQRHPGCRRQRRRLFTTGEGGVPAVVNESTVDRSRRR